MGFPFYRANVLVRGAVAIVAVLRANAVAVLRDFSCDPVGFGERADDVAHQLRLANAAGVSANYNHAPSRSRTHVTFLLVWPSSLASNSLMRAASSGKRACQANCSLNLSSGRAGVPHTVCPLRIILPPRTPDWPPMTAPSSRKHCSPNPAWPPTTTCLPKSQEPESPT